MTIRSLDFPSELGPSLRRWAHMRSGVSIEDQDPEAPDGPAPEAPEPEVARQLEADFFHRLVHGANEWIQFEAKPGVIRHLRAVSGHVWGDKTSRGPAPADVMVVGKCLGMEEQSEGRILCGPSGNTLLDACRIHNIPCSRWYVTNVLKTIHPDEGNGWSKQWLDEWLPVLRAELAIVRPKYIMCLGSEALKSVLGNRESLKKSEGRIYEVQYVVDSDDAGVPIYETALVMGVTHPAAILHKPQYRDQFVREVNRFGQMIRGVRWDLTESGLDHRVILSMKDLLALEREIKRECRDNLVAIDAEWEGAHPENKGSGLVSIQLSWKHKTAACIGLRSPGNVWRFKGGTMQDVMKVLYRILKGRQIAGHFVVADLEWLEAEGLPVQELFWVPETAEALQAAIEGKKACGFDTAYAMHAIEETADLSLKSMAVRLTEAPRYDVVLKEWLEQERSRRSKNRATARRELKKLQKARDKAIAAGEDPPDLPQHLVEDANVLSDEEEEVGFGAIPDEIRDPYACLQQGSLVQLEDESWEKIDVLVKNRYSGRVKSLAPDGRVVNARVVDWHRHEVNQKEWFQIQTAGAKYSRAGLTGPVLTPDHKVLTQRGKVQVQDLQPGEDSIATEELIFSKDQMSVFLGSLLGDGGFQRRNRSGVGFGFGQSLDRADYADWKAEAFSQFGPSTVALPGYRRYTLPFSRYLHSLADRFPTHPRAEHYDRKAIITQDVLANLGDLGLAVWYQDDGTLPRDSRTGIATSCRIYARKLTQPELDLLIPWLSERFGEGVSYNAKGGFIQFVRAAFAAFQDAILPFVHPTMSYKVVGKVKKPPKVQTAYQRFYDPVVAVVPCRPTVRRGTGVRYCLSVEGTRNFLTKVGFVSNCYDADVTRRIAVKLKRMLAADQFNNPCWTPFWITMRALPAILEINRSGMRVSRDRMDRLVLTYTQAQVETLASLRKAFRWEGNEALKIPPFNPDSHFEAREAIFGERFNKKSKKRGEVVRLRPKGAVSLYLTPTLTTGKRAMLWSDVLQKGLEDEKTPSTGRMALAILAHNPVTKIRDRVTRKIRMVDCREPLTLFRNYKVLAQTLRSSLRKPVILKDGTMQRRPDGYLHYAKGLPGGICDDGRVRTHVYPTKETGRWSSSRVPLHNLCFCPLTEILTPRGWILVKDLNADDQVAQYWPETKSIDFVSPELLTTPYTGDMVHLTGVQQDLLLTPNHRCFVRRQRGSHTEFPAEKLPVGTCNLHVHAGQHPGGSVSMTWAEIAWLVAVQADGSWVNGFDGQGVVFSFAKKRKQDRLRQILTDLGASFSEKPRKNGSVCFYVGVTENRKMVQRVKDRLGPSKDFGAWLLDLDLPTRQLFLEETFFWDGLANRQNTYFSTNKNNANWVQTLWSLSGVRARMRRWRPKAAQKWCWFVEIPSPKRRRDFTSLRKAKLEKVPYDGLVYCVTVPSSFVMVRRNGKVSITGNSKRREADYQKILGDLYPYPLRSMLEAEEGHLLVEADYIGAELFGMAVMADDEAMVRDAMRNQLPETDPDFYDIHSNIAVEAFRLPCEPTKAGLDSIKKKHLRDIAKTVIFGIAYGRQAKAIAVAAREQGVMISEEEAEAVRQAVFRRYPKLDPFFAECRRRASVERFIVGCMGRMRRAPLTDDQKIIGDLEREFMNFPKLLGNQNRVNSGETIINLCYTCL